MSDGSGSSGASRAGDTRDSNACSASMNQASFRSSGRYTFIHMLHVQLDRAPDRFPRRVAALHVPRVESRLPQRDRRLASHMESVRTKHHDRVGFRQFADPVRDALRITPDGTIHDVLLAGDVRPRTSIDDLDRRAGVQHGLDFLDANTRKIPELLLDERSG